MIEKINDNLWEIVDTAINHFRQRMADRGLVVKHVATNSELEFTRVLDGVPYLGNMKTQPCLKIKLTIDETAGPAGEELPYSTKIQYSLPFRAFTDNDVRSTFKYTKNLDVNKYSEKQQKIFAILYILIRGYDYVKTLTMPKLAAYKRDDIENYVAACVYDANTTIQTV